MTIFQGLPVTSDIVEQLCHRAINNLRNLQEGCPIKGIVQRILSGVDTMLK
jgi:hypothetical protein